MGIEVKPRCRECGFSYMPGAVSCNNLGCRILEELKDVRTKPFVSTKPTNPKDGIGQAKRPISYVPALVIQEVGVAMMEGGMKYGAYNWRKAGVLASVYFDAQVNRHLLDWWEGEDIDPDSGISHISKAIAGLMVLRDSMIYGNWVDDRPPVNPNMESHRAGLQAVVDGIREKYPEPVARCVEEDY